MRWPKSGKTYLNNEYSPQLENLKIKKKTFPVINYEDNGKRVIVYSPNSADHGEQKHSTDNDSQVFEKKL